MRLHEGDGEHVHELTLDQKGRLTEYIWKVENVELTTVGIDIGSSTSHLMFAAVRLQRKTQALSSRFVVVERRVLWKSPILLTPFAAGGLIDAARLGAFVAQCYRDAGLDASDVDTGAVILTGEAIKRANARALAELFAADSGRFVCASAGHHLECALAAHGSGAVAMSRETGRAILNVDVGGGTTKLARVEKGEVVATAALAVGGRLLAFDDEGRVARIDEAAARAAEACGVRIALGERPAQHAVERIVDALAQAAISLIRGEAPAGLAAQLLLTPAPPAAAAPDAIAFSGGVAEYVYGRESRAFEDIAALLAQRLRIAAAQGQLAAPLIEPREGIRATVIGASQFSVQVSGKTIHVGAGARLPLRNVPVIAPVLDLSGDIEPAAVARAIVAALERSPGGQDGALALALRWRGEPLYARLRALAEGIALAFAPRTAHAAPLVLMVDCDVGRTLGRILESEIAVGRAVVSIDGLELKELDFVDIGEMVRPADVVPVVIKSLLFPGDAPRAAPPLRYQPVQSPRRKPA
jgi:ethanolamine utilization protein EutA